MSIVHRMILKEKVTIITKIRDENSRVLITKLLNRAVTNLLNNIKFGLTAMPILNDIEATRQIKKICG